MRRNIGMKRMQRIYIANKKIGSAESKKKRNGE
jgi:hypothetical protein